MRMRVHIIHNLQTKNSLSQEIPRFARMCGSFALVALLLRASRLNCDEIQSELAYIGRYGFRLLCVFGLSIKPTLQLSSSHALFIHTLNSTCEINE